MQLLIRLHTAKYAPRTAQSQRGWLCENHTVRPAQRSYGTRAPNVWRCTTVDFVTAVGKLFAPRKVAGSIPVGTTASTSVRQDPPDSSDPGWLINGVCAL